MLLRKHYWFTATCQCFALAIVGSLVVSSHAAETVRSYPFGEADEGATIGGVVSQTVDIQIPPTEDADGNPVADSAGDLVPLDAFGGPTYIEGRDGPGSLGIFFDGMNDQLTSPAFDPRNFSSFAALSQAWVFPLEGAPERQFLWRLGNENGSVAISPEGKWEVFSTEGGSDTSAIDVEFNRWTHVAVFRGGNSAFLYVDGAVAALRSGFWNGPGDVVVGANTNGDDHFLGVLDDFSISGFSDGMFDVAADLDIFADVVFTDVPGDVDQDGLVNINDYQIWSENVGFDNGFGEGDPGTLFKGDVDGNGRINYFDFEIIRDEAAAAGSPIPEPSSAILLALGWLYFIRRRWM